MGWLVVYLPIPLKNDGVKVRLDHHPSWESKKCSSHHQQIMGKCPLVTVPFWVYWTSPYSSHLVDHIPNGWVMFNGDISHDPWVNLSLLKWTFTAIAFLFCSLICFFSSCFCRRNGLMTMTGYDMAVCQNLVPLVNIKVAGKWMFIPLKMVLIGMDPYPYHDYRSR